MLPSCAASEEEEEPRQRFATLTPDSASAALVAASIAFAKAANLLEGGDNEDERKESSPKTHRRKSEADQTEAQRENSVHIESARKSPSKRPLSRQFHWTLNQQAMEMITKEELDSIYRLFRFYDSSSYGDKLPSMNKSMFLQLLRDASMYAPPEFTQETAERIFAEAILGQLRTYLDAGMFYEQGTWIGFYQLFVDGNPVLTFRLFCGALLNCSLTKFPQMEPPMALSQVVLLCLNAHVPPMPVTQMMTSSMLTANATITPPSTTPAATSTRATPLSHEDTRRQHLARPTAMKAHPLPIPNIPRIVTPPAVDTHKSLVYELAANDKNPINWSAIGENDHHRQGQNDFRNEPVFQKVLGNLLQQHRTGILASNVDLDQLYAIPEDLKRCFPPKAVDFITEKFKTFDYAERGRVDKEEWYAMLSGMMSVVEFTDIYDVMKWLEKNSNTPSITLSDVFEALYACRRARTTLGLGSGVYENRHQARSALMEKMAAAKEAEEKAEQVVDEGEQANTQSQPASLPSTQPSPLNTANLVSTMTNSPASSTPNANANGRRPSKAIVRKRGEKISLRAQSQKKMSTAKPVDTSSLYSVGSDRESTISDLTELEISDLGFSPPPTASPGSGSSASRGGLKVRDKRGRHMSTGGENEEIMEAAATAAAAALHAASLEMSMSSPSLSSSFHPFVSLSTTSSISNMNPNSNSPRTNTNPIPYGTMMNNNASSTSPPVINPTNPKSTRDEPVATQAPTNARVMMILGESNDGAIYWEIQLNPQQQEDSGTKGFILLENSGIHYKTRDEIFEETKDSHVYVNFSMGLQRLRERVKQKIKEEGFHVFEGQELLQDLPEQNFGRSRQSSVPTSINNNKDIKRRKESATTPNSYLASTSRVSMRIQQEARSLDRAGTIVRESAPSMAFLSMLNERLMLKRYKEQCITHSSRRLDTKDQQQQSLSTSSSREENSQDSISSSTSSNNSYPQRRTSTVVETALQGIVANLSLRHASAFARRLSTQNPIPDLPLNYKELSSVSQQDDTSWIEELNKVRLDQQSKALSSPPLSSTFGPRTRSKLNHVAFDTTLERKQSRLFTHVDTSNAQQQQKLVDPQRRSNSASQLPTMKRPSLVPL